MRRRNVITADSYRRFAKLQEQAAKDSSFRWPGDSDCDVCNYYRNSVADSDQYGNKFPWCTKHRVLLVSYEVINAK